MLPPTTPLLCGIVCELCIEAGQRATITNTRQQLDRSEKKILGQPVDSNAIGRHVMMAKMLRFSPDVD